LRASATALPIFISRNNFQKNSSGEDTYKKMLMITTIKIAIIKIIIKIILIIKRD